MLELQNLEYEILRDKVVRDFSLKVGAGEVVTLFGASGCGKTTILRLISGLIDPRKGKIINKFNKTTYLFQENRLLEWKNALDNVLLVMDEPDEKTVLELFARLGLTEKDALKYPDELSGGMKKRVAMARALVLSPKILFLDEPNSGLDPSSARAFDELVVELRDTLGVTVVMVTHDIDSICTILDRFLILQDKKIAFEGTFEQLMQMPENPLEELLKTRKNGGK